MNDTPIVAETFHVNDVLSGKGNFVNSHPGNRHFRALVEHMKYEYVAAPKKRKPEFAKMVVSEIRSMNPPGRFLVKNKDTKQWEELEEKKALNKARQALREGAPDIEKKLKEGGVGVTTNYLVQWDAANNLSGSTIGEPSSGNSPNLGARDSARISHESRLRERLLAQIEEHEHEGSDRPESYGPESYEGILPDLGEGELEDFCSERSGGDEGDDELEDFCSEGSGGDEDADILPPLGDNKQETFLPNQSDDTNELRSSFNSLRLSQVFNKESFRGSMSICSSYLSSAASLMKHSLLSISDSGFRSSIESTATHLLPSPTDANIAPNNSEKPDNVVKEQTRISFVNPTTTSNFTDSTSTLGASIYTVSTNTNPSIPLNTPGTGTLGSSFYTANTNANADPSNPLHHNQGSSSTLDSRTSFYTANANANTNPPNPLNNQGGTNALGGSFYASHSNIDASNTVQGSEEFLGSTNSTNAFSHHNFRGSYYHRRMSNDTSASSSSDHLNQIYRNGVTFDLSTMPGDFLRASMMTNASSPSMATAPARLGMSMTALHPEFLRGSMYSQMTNPPQIRRDEFD